jgi:hypothetical protein
VGNLDKILGVIELFLIMANASFLVAKFGSYFELFFIMAEVAIYKFKRWF